MPLRIRLALGAAVLALALGAPARATAVDEKPSLRPGGPPTVGGLKVLAGSLHDHTTDSDGDTLQPLVSRWLYDHREELGLDYATFSDHSDFFPTSPLAAPENRNGAWRLQAQDLAQYEALGFPVLRGFEWTNDLQNHLNVIGSQNWTSRFTSGEAATSMLPFWEWLAADPTPDPSGLGSGIGGNDGIGQFNHPSTKGALNWDDYALHEGAARVMATIEIRERAAGWYWFALSKGWTVSPVGDFDHHTWTGGTVQFGGTGVMGTAEPGASCTNDGGLYLACRRTLVVAPSATRPDLMAALEARRTSSSERPDLWATLRGSPVGTQAQWMGSTVAGAPGEQLDLIVDAGSDTSALRRIDIVSDAGIDPAPTFEGDNPNWQNGSSTPQVAASYLLQHERFVASGGHTTKKGPIDEPPAGSIVASVPVSGARASETVRVTVPDGPSRRPDGRHFFYAIVRTVDPNPAPSDGISDPKAVTGPILTDAAVAPPPAIPETGVAWLLPIVGAMTGVLALSARRRRRTATT